MKTKKRQSHDVESSTQAHDSSRRDFLKTTAKIAAVAGLADVGAFAIAQQTKTKGDKMQALLLNGAKKFAGSEGRLSATLQAVAKETLESMGFSVIETIIDKGYDVQEEVQKIAKSDVLIYQLPAWWMGEPWIVKKYIDEVYIAGAGVLYKNDGRSRKDDSLKYGSGGLSQGKKVMLSVTWNAPIEAFTDKNGFFEGLGVEMVYFHLRKAHEFLGMQVLPTFMCNDVVKNPQVEQYIKDYKAHLRKVLG